MTRRRILLWGLIVVALATAAWGVARYLDGRPNPVLVRTLESASGVSPLEVEVARSRGIPMRVSPASMHGIPGSATTWVPDVHADDVADEVRELRRALDVWLAEPGRGLRVEQYWTSTEFRTGMFADSTRARVVLRARLVPVPVPDERR